MRNPFYQRPLPPFIAQGGTYFTMWEPNIPLFHMRLLAPIPEVIEVNPLSLTLPHYPLHVHVCECIHHIYSSLTLLAPFAPFTFPLLNVHHLSYIHFVMYMCSCRTSPTLPKGHLCHSWVQD